MNTSPQRIESPTSDVIAMEVRRKSTRNAHPVIERLYKCSNGMALGARRGGPLHLADDSTWEVFVIHPDGYMVGESVGFIGDAELDRLVGRLARWFDEAAA